MLLREQHFAATLQYENVDERQRKVKTMKDLRDLKGDIDSLEAALGSLYRIVAEKMTMTLEGARRWDRQVERLDGIMDDIRQDFQMLVEDSSEEF